MLVQQKKRIENTALILAVFLCVGYGFSLLARHSWFFDLFSNFTIQYVVGSLFLTILFLISRNWYMAAFIFLIGALNIYEIKASYSSPPTPEVSRAENLTIAHFNKLFRNQNWPAIYQWFREHPDIDILFVQESGVPTIEKLAELTDIFPYQHPATKKERFSDISVLSKIPFDITAIPIELFRWPRQAARISLKKEGWNAPVIIYSIHALTPLTPSIQAHRNQTLSSLAHYIAQDPALYKIFTGDWNITPYSPFFHDILEISNLQYQDSSLLPHTTWPAWPLPFFMKIPIDHVLYSPEITLVEKKVGPSLGSDHHMILAKFYIPES